MSIRLGNYALLVATFLVMGFAAEQASAQLQVTVGTGTSSSTTMQPVYRSSATSGYDFSKYSMLYTAADLAGMTPGSQVTDIEFWLDGGDTASGATANISIYLRNTTATNYTQDEQFSTQITGATLVYSNTAQTVTAPSGGGWYSFGAFNGGVFNYQGDSMEVIVDWELSGTTTAGFSWRYNDYTGGSATDTRCLGEGYFQAFTLLPTEQGITAANNHRIPHLRVTYTGGTPGTVLSQPGAVAKDFISTPTTDHVVMDIQAFTITNNYDLDSITFDKSGSVADGDVTNLTLYRDDNDNGIVDGDTSLGAGTLTAGSITFGTTGLQALNTSAPVRLILAVNLAASVSPGSSLQFSLTSAANVSFSGGTDLTTYPMTSTEWLVFGPVASFPYTQGFETPVPYSNAVITTGAQTVPVIISVGSTPSSASVSGASSFSVTGSVNSVTPNTGSGMFDMAGGTGTGATTLDLYFDMSSFSTSNYCELEFYWADEGLDVSATTDPLQGVFLSTDGGTTWEAAVFQFPTNGTTAVWTRETIDLSTIMTGLSLSYTNQMVIRFQMAESSTADHLLLDDIRVEDTVAKLRVRAETGQLSNALGGSTAVPVAVLDTTSLNSAQTLDSITFTQIGTVANTSLTNLTLWEDTNTDGVFSSGDTMLGSVQATMSGATVTFTSSPLRTYSTNENIRLFLTADLATAVSVPATIQFSINAQGDVSATPGNIGGTFPSDADSLNVKAPYSAFPFVQGFESPQPYTNTFFNTGAQTVPTVSSTPPSAPGVGSQSGSSGYDIATAAVAGSNPNSGLAMLDMYGGSGTGVTTMDMFFDMSTFSTTDYVGFEFYWNDEGVDSSTATNDYQGVFLSTDGGATWAATLFQFPPSQNTGIWNFESMDLSAAMTTLSLSYTSQMVIRFQLAENSTADHLLIDDILVDDPSDQFRVMDRPGTIGMAAAGGTDLPVAAIDTWSINSAQDLDSITFTHVGTANTTDLSNLKLWADTNGDFMFNSATDTQLGSTVASLSGSTLTFTLSTPRTYTVNEQIVLFVTADISATAAVPTFIQFRVNAVGDVTANPGFVSGAFPVDADQVVINAAATSLPYVLDFETVTSTFNATFDTLPRTLPTVVTVGAAPGSDTVTSTGVVQVSTGPVQGSNPNSGSYMLEMIGDTNTTSADNGSATMDLLFDLSTLNVATDFVELEFYWNDEGIDANTATDHMLGVFLSTNGGATWELALYQFPPSLNTGVWNQVIVDLSTMMSAASLNYTSQTMIRFQIAEGFNTDTMLLDDISLRLPPAQLRAMGGTAQPPIAAPVGQTDLVVGTFDMIGINSNQSIDSISVTKTGTALDSDITAVRLYEDTNNDGVFSTGDNQLATTTTFTAGVATFASTGMLTLNSTAELLFVTVDVSAGASVPATLGVSIDSLSDITANPGSVSGSAPISGGKAVNLVGYATLPYAQGFETQPPYTGTILTTAAQDLPEIVTVGQAPIINSSITNGGTITATGTAGASPNTGSFMLAMEGAIGTGSSTMDVFMDMSAFSVTDVVELDFYWYDDGLDSSSSTDALQGVFLSTNGGRTWELAVVQFSTSLNSNVWNRETINLSAMLSAASLSYSNEMLIRFQMAESSNVDVLLLDDITIEAKQDIDVSRNATSIANNGVDIVGIQTAGNTQNFTYSINNTIPTGGNDLNLSGGSNAVQINTTLNCNASITTQPASNTIAPGASETFILEITPQGAGTFLVELNIPSDDPDEPVYQVTVVGTGAEPEIDLQRPAGVSIPDAGTDPLGGVAANVTAQMTYYIVNGGNANLDLTGTPVVDLQNTTNVTATVISQPTSTTLAPAGLAPFMVEMTPGQGAFSFTLNIPNSDPDEGNYTVTVSGNGLDTPEIDIVDSTAAPIAEGGVFSIGTVSPGAMQTYQFTIENNGNMDLLLTGTPAVQISGQSNVMAIVNPQPASTTISVGSSETFTLEVTPTTTGSFNFVVQVLNNDANEGSYTFTVAGFASSTAGGGGGGGGGDDGGGCVADGNGNSYLWSVLLGALALLAVMSRVRVARD